MLRIQKRFNKATLYHLHRGLVSKSSRHNSGDTKKSKTNKTPLWCAPFIFHTKEQDKENKEQDDNAFISSLMSNKAWLTSKMDWLDLPSVEDINAKMTELYPQFTSQFKHLSDGYAKMWDYLTMEDFRKLVEEIKQEEKDPRLYPEMNKDATVREGNDLSDQEQDFIRKRKHLQKAAFAKFIGVDPNSIDERDIPVVGLASSGGGYRAMIGLAGYLNAMKQSGALGCVMYFTGISGSCWTMALYYNQLTTADPVKLKHHLQSHVNTHWANVSNFINVLLASPENSKFLMQGAIQRYNQQKGDLSLVDIFGILMGGTLLTKRPPVGTKASENKDDIKEQMRAKDTMEEINTRKAMCLTGQSEYLQDGSEPMPIYCVVRHDITFGRTLEDRLVKLRKIHERSTLEKAELQKLEKKKQEIERGQKDTYQWFEFTPYDMGCEEIEAWIPMWAFGREFERGKNLERLPEQTLDILMGMFGSAFAASLVHFYQEIRSFLPAGSLDKIDETIVRYEASMSAFHPISPSSFPNPFYKITETISMKDGKELKRPDALVNNRDLYLMDAGMDNNIPFYPLLRQGRDVDVILAMDLSADIQTATHFDRAESYIKRRGIKGWPTGAGWPKQKEDHSEDKYPLGSCTIFESEAKEQVTTTASESKTIEKQNPITLAYFPFIVNKQFDPDFDPQEQEFCSTWNFVYTADQVEKVTGLAEANWNDNLEKIRRILKKTWERKRNERLGV